MSGGIIFRYSEKLEKLRSAIYNPSVELTMHSGEKHGKMLGKVMETP